MAGLDPAIFLLRAPSAVETRAKPFANTGNNEKMRVLVRALAACVVENCSGAPLSAD